MAGAQHAGIRYFGFRLRLYLGRFRRCRHRVVLDGADASPGEKQFILFDPRPQRGLFRDFALY